MRAIGTVVVIALIILVIGLFAGWFRLTKETVAGETRVGVGVKGSEIERDAQSAKEAVKDLGHRIGDAIDGEDDDEPATAAEFSTLTGVLSSIDAGARQLTVGVGQDDPKTVRVEDAADVELNGVPVALLDLKAGDRVTVELRNAENGLPRATRVVARRQG